MVTLLFSTGHETTVNLIGNAVLALFDHFEERERLRADRGLAGSAAEEFLRYDGPATWATHRYTREPIELAGTVVPARTRPRRPGVRQPRRPPLPQPRPPRSS